MQCCDVNRSFFLLSFNASAFQPSMNIVQGTQLFRTRISLYTVCSKLTVIADVVVVQRSIMWVMLLLVTSQPRAHPMRFS